MTAAKHGWPYGRDASMCSCVYFMLSDNLKNTSAYSWRIIWIKLESGCITCVAFDRNVTPWSKTVEAR
jgi:hypothetical protein